MKSLLKYILPVTCFIASQGIANAAENHFSEVPQFENGDRIVFVGDSITHGGSYHKNVFLFYATRYPERNIRYYNAGISGDTAEGRSRHFEQDIAIHKPNRATIMLGMNDVSRYLYEIPRPTAADRKELIKQQLETKEKYLSNMHKLSRQLKALGSEIIYITPSIYDHTAEVERKNVPGLNDELSEYGRSQYSLAEQYGGSVVDFRAPMLRVNYHMQSSDPKATVVGHDRVHPGEFGHFVMAHAMLKAQGVSKYVSNIQLDAKAKKVTIFENCSLQGDVRFTDTEIAFTCHDKSLPFPLNDAQRKALKWMPFQTEMNQQHFAVKGLQKGQYQLSIGGDLVGEYNNKELHEGINLADNSNTPMYKQAIEVMDVHNERAKYSKHIRDIAHVRFTMVEKYPGIDQNDMGLLKETLDAHVEKSKGKPWYYYLKNQVSSYLVHVKNEEAYRAKVDSLFDQIYQVNQPKQHKWTLVKI